MKTIPIGLAGLGTVGTGVFQHLAQNRALIGERLGVEFEVRRIAVRDPGKPRDVAVPSGVIGSDPMQMLADPEIRIVVELMGGTTQAREFVLEAIRRGKIVVTGNKALLADHGEEIFGLAAERKVPVLFEAAVAGGIPIIKSLREAFIGNHIQSIHAILNGTCNYILTRMTEAGLGFPEALAEAQQLGYAEADPTLDVSGWDAAHKAIILASLAYGFWVRSAEVLVEGIDGVTAADIRFAEALGYRIKHLAMIKADASGAIEVRLHPTLIPKSHVLASVNGPFNALAVRGDVVGETLFYGRGAGRSPTASSVIADLCEAAILIESPRRFYGFVPHALYRACKPQEEVVSEYYLRLSVLDRPGVLAQVAKVLGDHDIGISSVVQPESHDECDTPLVLMIHDAPLGQMRRALEGIAALACVKARPVLFRVEGFQPS